MTLPGEFLDRHQSGVGKLLGISFPVATRHRVVAQLSIEPEHLVAHGAVHGSVIMALADCASSYGALLNLPPGRITTTLESKTNFLDLAQARRCAPRHARSMSGVRSRYGAPWCFATNSRSQT